MNLQGDGNFLLCLDAHADEASGEIIYGEDRRGEFVSDGLSIVSYYLLSSEIRVDVLPSSSIVIWALHFVRPFRSLRVSKDSCFSPVGQLGRAPSTLTG
jgi:hypothetical protein